MLNVKQIIDGYNKAILKIAEKAQPQKDEGKTCSCRKKEDCPLNGECLVREFICLESDCLIYTVISLERVNTYVMWERPLGEIPGEGNVCGSTKHCCYKNSGKSHGSFVNESVSSKPIPYFENARLTI